MEFGRRQKKNASLTPLSVGYYIANALLGIGAHIDKIVDLPLTVTISFTLKYAVFDSNVKQLLAFNLTGDLENKSGQLISSGGINKDIGSFEIMFIKAYFLDEARQELTA